MGTKTTPSVLLFSFLFLLGASSHAQTCEAVFTTESSKLAGDLLNSRALGAQRFLKLMRGNLASRYRLNADVAQMAHDLSLLDVSRTPQTYALKWPDAAGSISKNIRGTTLSYTIPSLIVQQNGTNLPLGARPKGLNSMFSKVLVGLMEAIRIDLKNNPQIDQVEMVAGSVVNMDLVALLKQSGFIRIGGDPITPAIPGQRLPPDIYVHQTPGAPFVHDMGFGMGSPMFANLGHAHPDRGRSWVLRFEVTR